MTELQMMKLRRYIGQWMDDSKVYWNDLTPKWRRTLAARKWYEDPFRGSYTYLYAHAIQVHTKGTNIDVEICTSQLCDFKLWMEIKHPSVTREDVGYFPAYMDEALSFYSGRHTDAGQPVAP